MTSLKALLNSILSGLNFFLRDFRPVQLVVFGNHTSDWMKALAPEAPVWKLIPIVRAVVLQKNVLEPRVFTKRILFRTVILPLMEDHIEFCPREYSALLPSRKAVEILRDKARFAQYVEGQGLTDRCPKIFARLEPPTFPCVVKRSDLNASRGIEIAQSPEQLADILVQQTFKDKPCIIQSYVEGDHEYVIHCVCNDGCILWHRCYRYALGEQAIRYPGAHAHSWALDPKYLRELEKFLRPLRFSGPCNADCKISKEGQLIVFEINPRLGGSLMKQENVSDLSGALSCIIDIARKPHKDSLREL